MYNTHMEIKTIAKIYTDFPEKFGLPRQSLLVEGLGGKIVFEKEFRNPDALRGINEYSHLWILWEFSEQFASKSFSGNAEKQSEENTSSSLEASGTEYSAQETQPTASWSPTVRPPRLGGNTRVGVFATRSPNRPNKIGMSVVKLVKVDYEDPDGPVIYVDGIDMMSGTPIIDIKPYGISDCVPDAKCGFADEVKDKAFDVITDGDLLSVMPKEKQEALIALLAQGPIPTYKADSDRVYGMSFAGFEIKFKCDKNTITILSIK